MGKSTRSQKLSGQSLLATTPSAPPLTTELIQPNKYPPPPPYPGTSTVPANDITVKQNYRTNRQNQPTVFMSNIPYTQQIGGASIRQPNIVFAQAMPHKTPKHARESILCSSIVIIFSLLSYRTFEGRLCLGAGLNAYLVKDISMDDLRDFHLYMAGFGALTALIAYCGAHPTYNGRPGSAYKTCMCTVGFAGCLFSGYITWLVLTRPCPDDIAGDIQVGWNMLSSKFDKNGRIETVFDPSIRDYKGVAIFIMDAVSTLFLFSMSCSVGG